MLIYDAGICEIGPFIAMELVHGDSLQGVLSTSGPMAVDAVNELAVQLLSALATAHDAGIIHRDIKPANVLLSADTGAKLTDFGVSRMLNSSHTLTAPGLFSGSIAYASPEQLAGGDAEPPSDLYSLGCVLYECLTGHPPFPESDAARGILQQRFADPVDVRMQRPDIPTGLANVVMRSLAKNPEDRYDSARSMAAALAGGTEPQTPLISDTVERPVVRGIAARRSRRRLAIAAIAVVLTAALVVGLLVGVGPSSNPPSRLFSGEHLLPGQQLASSGGRYRLTMDTDGALVLRVASTGQPIWSSGTEGHPDAFAVMQSDGNFVVYPKGKGAPRPGQPTAALYTTLTDRPGATFSVLDSGNLTVGFGSSTQWQSGSGPAALGSSLTEGQGIHPLQYLTSSNGRYRLMNSGWTGRLSIVESADPSCVRWTQPGTSAIASVAVLEPQGGLVMYAPVHRPVWTNGVVAFPGPVLTLDNDGILRLSSDTATVWQVPPAHSPVTCRR